MQFKHILNCKIKIKKFEWEVLRRHYLSTSGREFEWEVLRSLPVNADHSGGVAGTDSGQRPTLASLLSGPDPGSIFSAPALT
jgi:hypothetical protein